MITDTKKLAEFAAEFLELPNSEKVKPGEHTEFPDIFLWKLEIELGIYHIGPKSFFDNTFGPILAHLAKREMEKREYTYEFHAYWSKRRILYSYEFMTYPNNEEMSVEIADENEYQALWTAIEATGEK